MARPSMLFLRKGDLLGICIGAMFIALVLYAFVEFPGPVAKHVIRSDRLGPGWTCQYVADGEPVCIKDAPTTPKHD